MSKNIVRTGIVILGIIGIALFYTQYAIAPTLQAPTIPAANKEVIEPIFTYIATSSGQTAFELTQQQADIEYSTYAFGNFITSINGIAAPDSYFWQLLHNGSGANVGASDLQLQTGDTITWQLTKQ